MAGMSRTNSTSLFQGFSVFQPSLGTALQWLPDLGSQELEDLINAFLPGPASIQDKRAHISMDFYEYSRQTGETFKFYPVYTSFTPTTTDSPASSSAMRDSGYGSSFNVSPVVSNMSPWTPSLSVSTPASTTSDPQTKSRSGPSQRTASSNSRQRPDFSQHPGMRILTMDGRDITTSASRGCKSKEQRDHAHLMRVIKACDACRRKKVRCDPSHKRRAVAQAQHSRSDPKQTKKPQNPTHEPRAQGFSLAAPGSLVSIPSFETEAASADPFENLNEIPDDFWQQFVHLDDPAVSFAEGYDSFMDPTRDYAGYFTPSNGSSSTSSSQSLIPSTLTHPGTYGTLPVLESQSLPLPYLNPDQSYGTDYQDFNLYSPTSEISDEELELVRKPPRQEYPSRQDNQVVFNHRQAALDATHIEGGTYLRQGQNHQHGPLLQTALSDWPSASIGTGGLQEPSHPARSLHGLLPTAIDPGKKSVVIVDGESRPRPSPSLADYRHPSVERVPSGPLDYSAPTEYANASTSTKQGPRPASVNGRLDTSRVPEVSGPLPTAYANRMCLGTQGTRLAQTPISSRPWPSGEHRSTAQPEALEVLTKAAPATYLSSHGQVSARSTSALESNKPRDLVTRDRVTSSFGSSATRLESGLNNATGKPICLAGLRETTHDYAALPSRSTTVADPSAAAVQAGLLPPSPSWPEDTKSSWPRAVSTMSYQLVALVGLAAYLLVSLMRQASVEWELKLLFGLSLASCIRPLRQSSMDRFVSATTKRAGFPFGIFSARRALPLTRL